MLAIVVIGFVGYGSLGLDQFPKIDLPTVLVTTTLQVSGAWRRSRPRSRTRLKAPSIRSATSTKLRSSSSEGVSLVTLSFGLDKNIDVGTQEVRDHINGILTSLPKGIDQPVVTKIDPDAAPIMLITLRAKGTQRDLTELADKRVRRQIESINGVGQVTILGGRKREINLWLDPVRLAASGITASDVERMTRVARTSRCPGGRSIPVPDASPCASRGASRVSPRWARSSSARARTMRHA